MQELLARPDTITQFTTMAATAHEAVVQAALAKGIVSEDSPLVLFFDVDAFKAAIQSLKDAFPDNFLHTFAVKSNPTLSIMKIALEQGLGFEAASYGELTQALAAGDDPRKIVFDSPCKAKKELMLALEWGVHMNIDNWQELERVQELLAMGAGGPIRPGQWIGLRINPQVGAGAIATHSTATMTSKFGIGLRDDRARVLRAYADNRWLNAVHVHVGSQGVGFELAAAGIKAAVELAREVNEMTGRRQVTCIDIGGGMPVNFASAEIDPTFSQYAELLKANAPELFTGEFTVITEFGRSLCAKAGWFCSRVEYTKVTGGRHIASQHAGANIAIRTIYHPTQWPLRVTVLDQAGRARAVTAVVVQDIAGPCCIQGDIIAHQRELPLIHPADLLVIHDCGGYYHSSYSRYNLLLAPPVMGYSRNTDGALEIRCLQAPETVREALHMFRMP